jgi:solute carrier family 10 (sodium/bile acid cotransporter), member 7
LKRPDFFLLGMGAAVVLAWLFPDAGAKGGRLHPELINKLGVSLIFFLHGLMLSFEALAAGTRKWRVHLLVQGSTFLLFPLLGLGLLGAVGGHLSPQLRTGVFFLCALPSTVSSSVALTAAARGNVAVAVFNATLSSLLGVVLTPLWLSAVLGTAEHALPLGSVVLDLLLWLVLPLLVGQAARPFLGRVAAAHASRIHVADRLTILLLVYTSFCDSMKGGVWRSGGWPLAISAAVSVLLLSVALGLTWLLGRACGFERQDRVAALFCGSKKTLASGVPMARLIFGAEPGLALILLPIMIFHPLQLVVGGWLAGRLGRASAD